MKKKEIQLIYNSSKQEDRKALGYAQSLKDYVINDFDVNNNKFTERQLAELTDKLNIAAHDLLVKEAHDKNLSDEDVLKLIREQPELLRTPIRVEGKNAKFVDTGLSFIKDALE